MALEGYAELFFSEMLSNVKSNLIRREGEAFYDPSTAEWVMLTPLPVGTPVAALRLPLSSEVVPIYTKIIDNATGHSSGGYVVTFDPVLVYTDYNYLIVGPTVQENTAAPYMGSGNTGCTNLTDLITREDIAPETCFVDFEGSYDYSDADRAVEGGCVYDTVTKFRDFYIIDSVSNPTEPRVTFGHNSNPSFCDGTCPGVACIEVIDTGDQVGLAGYMSKGHLGSENFRIKQGIRFWIDSENNDTDEIQVSIGFTCAKDGYVEYAGFTQFMPGISFHYNYTLPRNTDGSYPVEVRHVSDFSGSAWESWPAGDAGKWLAAGSWLTLDMYYDRITDTGAANLTGVYGDINIGMSLEYFGADPVGDLLPMILVKKKKGNKSMKVYVDYIYYGTEPL